MNLIATLHILSINKYNCTITSINQMYKITFIVLNRQLFVYIIVILFMFNIC